MRIHPSLVTGGTWIVPDMLWCGRLLLVNQERMQVKEDALADAASLGFERYGAN